MPGMRTAYQTDLSDAEWALIEPHLPAPRAPGRPRVHSLREILDAVFYVVRGGCTWRLLPHEFPPWKSVYHYFRLWRIETVVGSGCTRHYAGGGRGYTSAETRSPARWHRRQPEREEHRHRRGRARLRPGQEGEGHSKRHLLVATQGLVLKAKGHAANVFERDGIKPLMELVEERFPGLSHLCGSMPARTARG